MYKRQRKQLAFACLMALNGFALAHAASAPQPAAAANPDLAKLEAEDQADRASGSGNIDWAVVSQHDAARRDKTLALLRAGVVRSADDYFNAALIFQHGEAVEDTQLAFSLATTAARLDPKNSDARMLTAQAWDRILVKSGKPQWYGTQFSRDKATGKWVINPTDPTAVTEAQREAMGIPTLAQTQAHLDAMNARTKP
ncbi:hypothetical protein L2Y96_17585 [Luteibacter aegosomaticola]|uniref:hypothetical protein n=1 Tax=Luteibacter aegosomaticola TaxID=2911538 RepID=UPI001FF739EB|nr:hypothetical protein [Luteibacter aegosomaticola]UPG89190.1 hypothetical protein L2Y96_17585 [Luteibacter aegosomaticola]